jgi:hypothetical protein
MPAFSVTPLTDMPAAAPKGFPTALVQYQADGENLGLADADTLNFAEGLTATRGVGENSNVVTVIGGGGGGAGSALFLTNNIPFAFDNVPFDAWNASPILASDDWAWDTDLGKLVVLRQGVYRIVATCSIQASSYMGWPPAASAYGSAMGLHRSAHTRYYDPMDGSDTTMTMDWTDQHLLTVTSDDPTVVSTSLWAMTANGDTYAISAGRMTLVIDRLGDYVP